MAKISVAILGLKRTGASVGLALNRYNSKGAGNSFTVAGYDTSQDIAKAAQKMGAVAEIDRRIEALVRDKDIVVIALPYGEVEAAYELIGESLRPGAVVMDMTALAQASLRFAKQHLPKEGHVVCIAPVINPKYLFEGVDESARASEDFFDGGIMMIMPSVNCVKEAVTLATDFAKIVGATPNFYDPVEYDALSAGTEGLPSLLGVILFHMLSQNDGWSDIQRLTNPAFGMATRHLFDTHPDDLGQYWQDSGAALVRFIDEMALALRAFRELLVSGDEAALANAVDQASRRYEKWINRRLQNRWEDGLIEPELPTAGSMMGSMFGRLPFRRGGDDDDDKE